MKGKDRCVLELSKDVSSFANSQGGTIVYGVVEEPRGHPKGLDTGYDPADNIGEWLDQVINSNIHPRPDGIRINEARLSTGRLLYVVWVPQGRTAHQAADKRYYKRFNYQSVPMEAYEVRDVMRRAEAPDLTVELRLAASEVSLAYEAERTHSQPVDLHVLVSNAGDTPAEYSLVILYIPVVLEVDGVGLRPTKAQVTIKPYGDGQEYECWTIQQTNRPPRAMPIFRTTQPWEVAVLQLRFPPQVRLGNHVLPIAWQVEAPYMQPRAGVFELRVVAGSVMLQR